MAGDASTTRPEAGANGAAAPRPGGVEQADTALAQAVREAVLTADGDEARATLLLTRWIDAAPALHQQLIAWGCARGWWTPTTWGRENGVWELALRSLVGTAAQQYSRDGNSRALGAPGNRGG